MAKPPSISDGERERESVDSSCGCCKVKLTTTDDYIYKALNLRHVPGNTATVTYALGIIIHCYTVSCIYLLRMPSPSNENPAPREEWANRSGFTAGITTDLQRVFACILAESHEPSDRAYLTKVANGKASFSSKITLTMSSQPLWRLPRESVNHTNYNSSKHSAYASLGIGHCHSVGQN